MRFSDSEYCLKWLQHFEAKDIQIAKSVIDSMWFVSEREVVNGLWKNVELALSGNAIKKIAFYPTSNKDNQTFGSEHLIGYLLEHFKESVPFKCTINPNELELVTGNYSHLVIVDDIVGSGDTLCEFLKRFITPKIRSGVSSKRFEIHLSCFCAYDNA